jgi:predicted CxxxxCH...CXXCH cytochrome family protein
MIRKAKKGLAIFMGLIAGIAICFVIFIGVYSTYAGPTPTNASGEVPANVSVQAGGSASEKSKGIVTLSFFLSGPDTLNSITISNTGLTAGTIDVYVYVNTKGQKTLRNAVLLGSVTGWNGSSTTISKAGGIAYGSSGAYVFIVYDLPNTATGSIQTNLTQVVTNTTWNGTISSGSNPIIVKTACVDLIQINDCGKCHNYNGYYHIYYPYSTVRGNQKSHDIGYGRIHGGYNKYDCAFCHGAAVNNYSTSRRSTSDTHMDGSATVSSTIVGISTNGTYSAATKTCSNIDCHNNVTTPKWGTRSVNPNNLSTCSVCHAAPPNTGAHTAHFTYITGWGNNSSDCQYCHYGSGPGYPDKHANGNVDVVINPTLGTKNGTNPTDLTPTYTPSGTRNGTCSNVRCHGGITTLAWTNGAGTTTIPEDNTKYRVLFTGEGLTNKPFLKCNLCHTVDNPTGPSYNNVSQYNSARSAKHYAHAITSASTFTRYTGMGYNRKRIKISVCLGCHNDAHKSDITTTGNTIAFSLATISDINLNNPQQIGGTPPYGTGAALATYSDSTTTAANLTLDNTKVQSIYYSATSTSGTCTTTVCHGNNITWNPTTTLSCISCHSSQIGSVANVVAEFSGTSHHVQGVALDSSHCYKCHWEASDANGNRNSTIHQDGIVQLVAYNYNATNNSRYDTSITSNMVNYNRNIVYALNVNNHCLVCHNDNMKGKQPFGDGVNTNAYSWTGDSIAARYSTFGRYSSHTYSANVYNVVPIRIKSPSVHYDMKNNQRGIGISALWTDDAPTQATRDTVGSANNAGSVACLDCHNSHGSNIPRGTYRFTMYSSKVGGWFAGMLKQTTAGTHGYGINYTPKENTTYQWSVQAALCFDCHLGPDTATGGVGATNTTAPKNYTNYGRTVGNIVAGYYDPVNWQDTIANRDGKGRWYANYNTSNNNYTYNNTQAPSYPSYWNGTFAYKAGTVIGTHFKKHIGNVGNGIVQTDWKVSANSNNVNSNIQGRCTACHDPHGVNTNRTGPNTRYYLPNLKGMWLTSPYFEDRPGDRTIPANAFNYFTINALNNIQLGINNSNIFAGTRSGERGGPRFMPYFQYNRPPTIGAGYGKNTSYVGQDGFFIDDNTFGLRLMNDTSVVFNFANFNNNASLGGDARNFWIVDSNYNLNASNVWANIGKINEIDAQFGGLCLSCHPASKLIATNSSFNTRASNFRTHVHRTVKGWASGNYANNEYGDIFPHYYVNRIDNTNITKGFTGGSVNVNRYLSQQLIAQYNNENDVRLIDATSFVRTGIGITWGVNLKQQINTTATANVQQNSANQYHNFPCSKCHTPHASRLPRLMKTNCLDVWISADVANNWYTNNKLYQQKHSINSNSWIYRMKVPTGNFSINDNNLNNWTPARAVRCHNSPLIKDATNRTFWNDVTPWQ